MPIRRYADWLRRRGELERYQSLLVNHFNPAAVPHLMCRDTVSVDWRGELYDCDFNQVLELPLGAARRTLWDVDAARRARGRGRRDGRPLLRLHGGRGLELRRGAGRVSEALSLWPRDRWNEALARERAPAGLAQSDSRARATTWSCWAAAPRGSCRRSSRPELGARVALVEKHLLGGDCLNYGCVPSKTLLRSARAAADAREANRFGVRVPDGVEVDFAGRDGARAARARRDLAARLRAPLRGARGRRVPGRGPLHAVATRSRSRARRCASSARSWRPARARRRRRSRGWPRRAT